jgi:hypothetical protein
VCPLFACTPPATSSSGDGDGDTDADADTDTDADADADAESGPDNATASGWEAVVEDEIDENEVDWFSIPGVAGQQFRIQLENPEEDSDDDAFDSVVQVFDAELRRIAWEDEHPAGDVATYDSVCFGFFPENGTYFVTVEDRRHFEGGESPAVEAEYSLSALTTGSLPVEPDSLLSVGIGAEMDNDNSWYGFPVLIDEDGDTDYVLLELPHADGAIAIVTAQHIEGSVAVPLVDAYNSAGQHIFSAKTTAPASCRPRSIRRWPGRRPRCAGPARAGCS